MTIEMPELEQLTIDESAGEFNKQPPAGHDGDTSRVRCILTLPDELLSKILDYSVLFQPMDSWSKSPLRSGYDPAIIMTVALTCRRFSQILVPFYYRVIFSDYVMKLIPPNPRLELLLRTLHANPSLGLHCRVLNSFIPDTRNHEEPDGGCGLAEQLPALVPNIKRIHLRGCFGKARNKQAWTFLTACVRHMHQLDDVALQRQAREGLEVADFLAAFQDSSLKILRVGGGFAKSSSPEDMKIQETSSLKIMELEKFSDSAEALRILLSWPEALSSFRLSGSFSDGLYIDLPMVKDMLFQHRNSLVSLDIGHLPREGRAKLCDFSEFSVLEKLSLSRWHFGESREKLLDSQQIFENCLSPPRLRKFTWTFSMMDSAWPQWYDFEHEEESWVRNLAQTAISRKSLLRKIRIFYYPLTLGNPELDYDYPWDRMDALNEEFHPHGIAITYTKPPTTREKWASNRANADAIRHLSRLSLIGYNT